MPHAAEIHLKPDVLARYGLPDIAYPLPVSELQAAMGGSGDLPLAMLLQALQQHSAEGSGNWQLLEPAMERLSELLTPDDVRPVAPVMGDDWWLELGPLDLAGELVTIQREDSLVAALSAREDGRLRVAVFRPLDAKSAEYLIGLGQLPHPEHGVCMRENNWQYALDCSAGTGNYYAADRGEAYLSYWERGLGVSRDGVEIASWYAQRGLVARQAAVAATELGVHYVCSNRACPHPFDYNRRICLQVHRHVSQEAAHRYPDLRPYPRG